MAVPLMRSCSGDDGQKRSYPADLNKFKANKKNLGHNLKADFSEKLKILKSRLYF